VIAFFEFFIDDRFVHFVMQHDSLVLEFLHWNFYTGIFTLEFLFDGTVY